MRWQSSRKAAPSSVSASARGPLQQLDAQPGFERVEAAPDHGRRDALGARRRRQAAARDDLDEGGNLANLPMPALPICDKNAQMNVFLSRLATLSEYT
jgi:hypothetical protein